VDLLIFDMDGVLIDVSNSYREAIRRTVDIYLGKCLGFRTNRRFVSKEEISLFKSIGGFNNDWDLTSGLLLYLLSLSGLPPYKRKKRFASVKEILCFLDESSRKFSRDPGELFRRKDLPPFAKKVKSLGGGLNGIRRALNESWEGWIYRSGDLARENLVERIFQEVYLGPKFSLRHHLRPLFYRGRGLYAREKLLIPRRILSSLRTKARLGIASGRPRFEAELVLRRFRLLHYFDSVVTLDECAEEEARIFHTTGKRKHLLKPHPYSLLRVIEETRIPRPRCAYVGDVVDDMLAVRAIKNRIHVVAVGFLNDSRNRRKTRESLLKAGADGVISDPNELLDLLGSSE
jgi:HAD superfamily hydrolase (TIGR01548 family)